MGGEITNWGSAIDTIAPRESYVHDHAAPIAFGHQLFEAGEKGAAGVPLGIHGRDIIGERTPGCPDPDPVKPGALHVFQVLAPELAGSPQRSIVTQPA